MSKKSLAANVTIGRFQSSVEPHEGVWIRIGDELSGLQIIEVEMTMEEFARAITGAGYSKGTHDLQPDGALHLSSRIGKKLRAETVLVEFDMHKEARKDPEVIARMVRKIKEMTGCDEVHHEDLFNSHRTYSGSPAQQSVVIWFYDEAGEAEVE